MLALCGQIFKEKLKVLILMLNSLILNVSNKFRVLKECHMNDKAAILPCLVWLSQMDLGPHPGFVTY